MDFLLKLAQQLEGSAFALAIQESDWMFPALETIHVLALAIVFGSIAMVDLRLMGLFSRLRRVSDVADEALPWTWIAFVCAVLSGALMFASKAVTYYGNWPFKIKVLLIAFAGMNMMYFHMTTYRSVAGWNQGTTPPRANMVACLSLLLWISTLTLGRWIGFTTRGEDGSAIRYAPA